MSKCIMLIGIPGSGKSTYAKKYYPYTVNGQVYWRISSDSVIESIAHEYNMTYNDCFQNLIKFAEQVMWQQLERAKEIGINVVIDRTNMSKKSRKKFFDFFEGYEFEAIVFKEPEDLQERLKSRAGKTISKKIIDSMRESFQMPTEKEGFTKICQIG